MGGVYKIFKFQLQRNKDNISGSLVEAERNYWYKYENGLDTNTYLSRITKRKQDSL
jgi:hypothetical protein